MGVALLGQHAEHPRAVGADQRARRGGGSGELDKLFGPGRIGHRQTHPAQREVSVIHLCPKIFHRNHDRNLRPLGRPACRWPAPDSNALIDLDHTTEQLAVAAHHRPAQACAATPRRSRTTQPQYVVQLLRRGHVLLRGHQPDRGKPRAQRRTGAVKASSRRVTEVLRPHPTHFPVLSSRSARTPSTATSTERQPRPPAQTRQILSQDASSGNHARNS